MQVHVQDVNEYVPAWDEEEYSGEVGEGEMAESIVTLTARDRDCSPTFGSICGYSITRHIHYSTNIKGPVSQDRSHT